MTSFLKLYNIRLTKYYINKAMKRFILLATAIVIGVSFGMFFYEMMNIIFTMLLQTIFFA